MKDNSVIAIDTGSCSDVILEDAMTKLYLKVEPHPNMYYVAWITSLKLNGDKGCLVTFNIGNFAESIMCNGLPLMLSHILVHHP